jgi:hypothetical protein
MNVLSDFVASLRLAGDSRPVPALRQTILLQTFYPGLTPDGCRSAKAIPMNFHFLAATARNRLKAELQTIFPARV